ncbi:MAG TPA: DUF4238 domain-containing protein, partial [Anaerolineales bacterium]|nr:DUF4238 domain-containing protein [Anaerolineales bacterium]
ETDYYTIKLDDGTSDLSLEQGLSQLEDQFIRIRRDVIEKRLPLNDEHRFIVCAFVGAMYGRTKASRERIRPFWNGILDKMDQWIQWSENATEDQKRNAATYFPIPSDHSNYVNYEEIKEIVDEPVKSMLVTYIDVTASLLMKVNLAIVCTSTKPGFITSDDPCVWSDPESSKQNQYHRGHALASPFIEIHLPISPHQCLLFNRRGDDGYIDLGKNGPLIDITTVNEANWRTRNQAQEFFVVNRNRVLAAWFDNTPNR